MQREPVVGECVVVTRNHGDHDARVGDRFVVAAVDEHDDTIRGLAPGTAAATDYWIPWSDIEPVEFGWEYARQHLPADIVRLLAACDGIGTISLNSKVKIAILVSLPDWRERVMATLDTHYLDEI